MSFEIRYNDDGSVDEIVGNGEFHLEQMDDDEWFLLLDGVRLFLVAEIEDWDRPVIRANLHEVPVAKQEERE